MEQINTKYASSKLFRTHNGSFRGKEETQEDQKHESLEKDQV